MLALTSECLCVYVAVVNVHVPVHCLCAPMWSQRRAPGVLCPSLPYCLETDSPTKPEAPPLARLAGQRALGILLSLCLPPPQGLRLQVYSYAGSLTQTPGIQIHVRMLARQTCLPTEPQAQPPYLFL